MIAFASKANVIAEANVQYFWLYLHYFENILLDIVIVAFFRFSRQCRLIEVDFEAVNVSGRAGYGLTVVSHDVPVATPS